MAVLIGMLTLGVKNAALAIAVNLGALLANLADSVGLVWVRIDVENRVGSVGGIRAGGPGSSSGRVGTRVGTRERSTSNERTADGKNDTHGHGGGKDGSHAKLQFRAKPYAGEKGRTGLPGNNGPDGIIGASWGDGEPEYDVGQVDDPDGLFWQFWLRGRNRGEGEKRRRTP